MPAKSKFTAPNRAAILAHLRIGASRRTAAAAVGVDESQVRRWVKRGSEAAAGTPYRKFYEEVLAAEAAPRVRALALLHEQLPDNPALIWKYIERQEPGYAPPMPNVQPVQAGPVVIQLTLHDGSMPALGGGLPPLVGEAGEIVDGEVVDEQDVTALPAPSTSA